MSARAYHRILKLARTITDLAGSARIKAPQVAETIQYRPSTTLVWASHEYCQRKDGGAGPPHALSVCHS